MQKKVLIAVGNKQYSDILKNAFLENAELFSLTSQEIFHRRFSEEIVDLEKPDILILHDYYLESDFMRNEEKEKEWRRIIRKMRVKYDDSLRIVFLCERPKGDLLLASLVSLGVRDVFNDNCIDLEAFIQQLSQPTQFSNVEKFLSDGKPILLEGEGNNETENENVDQVDDVEKVIKKVIEKKVVQKVINKNVIKRDYNIQITNYSEKIVGVPVKKKLILIGSPLPRSGSTFISHLLARALTQIGVSTTYVESPFSRAYTYDRFIGDRSDTNYRSKFYQFNKDQETKFDSSYDWVIKDVEIICKNTTLESIYKPNDITFESFIKVLFSTSSTVTIIDVGTDWHSEVVQDLLDISDHAFFIIEPDIPYIQYLEESSDIAASFLIQQLQYDKAVLIGNRFDNTVVNKPLIKKLYKSEFLTYFPAFPVADVFQAQYQGIFLNDLNDYSKKIHSYIEPILEEILPKEFMKKQQKGTGIFKGLFKKKISVEKIDVKGENVNEATR